MERDTGHCRPSMPPNAAVETGEASSTAWANILGATRGYGFQDTQRCSSTEMGPTGETIFLAIVIRSAGEPTSFRTKPSGRVLAPQNGSRRSYDLPGCCLLPQPRPRLLHPTTTSDTLVQYADEWRGLACVPVRSRHFPATSLMPLSMCCASCSSEVPPLRPCCKENMDKILAIFSG